MAQVEAPPTQRERSFDWFQALAEHRQMILTEMVRACGLSPREADIDLLEELWERSPTTCVETQRSCSSPL